jgi:hypothetical protein
MSYGMFLSSSSLIHMWLMGNKWKYAPLLGIVLQLCWAYYGVFIINDYGFLIGSIGFTIVHIRNAIKWLGEDNESKTS